jgi:hypothetical protein
MPEIIPQDIQDNANKILPINIVSKHIGATSDFVHTYDENRIKREIYIKGRTDERAIWIPSPEYKQITGHDNVKLHVAYDEGYRHHEMVMMKWISDWDGHTNSALGALLDEVFKKLKKNA